MISMDSEQQTCISVTAGCVGAATSMAMNVRWLRGQEETVAEKSFAFYIFHPFRSVVPSISLALV